MSIEMPVTCFAGNVFLERMEVIRTGNITRSFLFHLITEGELLIVGVMNDYHLLMNAENQLLNYRFCSFFRHRFEHCSLSRSTSAKIFERHSIRRLRAGLCVLQSNNVFVKFV